MLFRSDAQTSREDVPTLRTGFPSRHLAQAIREYAPGAGVVVNGMVYDSAGIALAWERVFHGNPSGIDTAMAGR